MYDQILHILREVPWVSNSRIVELKVYGRGQFRVKIRGDIREGLALQIWINHNPMRTRYSYQLIGGGKPILRWDNAPHHPELGENFPHHFHDQDGALSPSGLAGKPLQDVREVLDVIESWVKQRAEGQW